MRQVAAMHQRPQQDQCPLWLSGEMMIRQRQVNRQQITVEWLEQQPNGGCSCAMECFMLQEQERIWCQVRGHLSRMEKK